MTQNKTMQRYIGTKIIHAEPRAKDYGPPEGHGQPGYTVVYPDGYTSWSPAAAFEEAYRPCDAMTFGLAIEAMKKGLRVARAGWNGEGMWIEYVPGRDFSFSELLPHFAIKNANNSFSTWVPSINDCLAEDWRIVE